MVRFRVVGSDPLEWGITQEEFTKYVAKVRRDALLEAANLYCGLCKQGEPVRRIPNVVNNGIAFDHDIGNYMGQYCNASRIHKLLAAEQGQDKE